MPPLWPTSAIPGCEAEVKRFALGAMNACIARPSTLLMNPWQFGPTSARPPSRAIRVMPSCMLRSPVSANPAAKISAVPTRRRVQAAMASLTAAAGSVSTARSMPSGRSSTLTTLFRPSMGSALRLTRWIIPENRLIVRHSRAPCPALPGREENPTMAIERGRNRHSTGPLGSLFIGAIPVRAMRFACGEFRWFHRRSLA